MKTVWTTGLSSDDTKKDIAESFSQGALLRRRLSELLQDKMDTEVVARTKREDYESPSWAYKQADSSGYLRALREVISLIE